MRIRLIQCDILHVEWLSCIRIPTERPCEWVTNILNHPRRPKKMGTNTMTSGYTITICALYGQMVLHSCTFQQKSTTRILRRHVFEEIDLAVILESKTEAKWQSHKKRWQWIDSTARQLLIRTTFDDQKTGDGYSLEKIFLNRKSTWKFDQKMSIFKFTFQRSCLLSSEQRRVWKLLETMWDKV